MITDPSAILFMGVSLLGKICILPSKEAHFMRTCYRLGTSLRKSWEVSTLSFSKSVLMHEACLLLFLHRYHRERAILLK